MTYTAVFERIENTPTPVPETTTTTTKAPPPETTTEAPTTTESTTEAPPPPPPPETSADTQPNEPDPNQQPDQGE